MPVPAPVTQESLDRAAALVRSGGVVAFPTETVYGLGANALDAAAVARIFEIKRRPAFDPLIVHVLDEAMLDRVATGLDDRARGLIERFWPGPLTLVLSKRPEVPGMVTAGLETVAVRMPSHAVARSLLERTGLPLAAPSANPFGSLSPTRAEHVALRLADAVDLILDGGATDYGVESTIVQLAPHPVLLRPGALAVESIEAIVGRLERSEADASAPRSPGRLPQHYAPRTPMRIVAFERVGRIERAGAGALAFASAPSGYAAVRTLSPDADLREAAARFFERLHELDALGVERIDAEPVPERGLGLAIMDRLRRASCNF
jgi:L-threonylcarbamoyladenylate synthase